METAGQVPVPVQDAACVSTAGVVAVPATQDRARHPWVLAWNWHRAVPAPFVAVLLPTHRPFRPQVIGFAAATHAVAGSGSAAPAGTAVQVPTLPARLQDSQVPLQAVSQQTPFAPSDR